MTGRRNKFCAKPYKNGNKWVLAYFARPMPTELKRYRDAVPIGEKRFKWKLCALVRKWIYEIV